MHLCPGMIYHLTYCAHQFAQSL
uniref:Eukaryotic translation initiation factor 4g, putative n=1 Tax=Arundo donax TaxID=35708 RepID=A0A0A9B3E6_ARUDO